MISHLLGVTLEELTDASNNLTYTIGKYLYTYLKTKTLLMYVHGKKILTLLIHRFLRNLLNTEAPIITKFSFSQFTYHI